MEFQRIVCWMETLLSLSKYFLSNAFAQNIGNCSVAFSLLLGISKRQLRQKHGCLKGNNLNFLLNAILV